MLKADTLVVLSKHVRSVLVHDEHVARQTTANNNGDVRVSTPRGFDDESFVAQGAPRLNALSSGHGSGF